MKQTARFAMLTLVILIAGAGLAHADDSPPADADSAARLEAIRDELRRELDGMLLNVGQDELRRELADMLLTVGEESARRQAEAIQATRREILAELDTMLAAVENEADRRKDEVIDAIRQDIDRLFSAFEASFGSRPPAAAPAPAKGEGDAAPAGGAPAPAPAGGAPAAVPAGASDAAPASGAPAAAPAGASDDGAGAGDAGEVDDAGAAPVSQGSPAGPAGEQAAAEPPVSSSLKEFRDEMTGRLDALEAEQRRLAGAADAEREEMSRDEILRLIREETARQREAGEEGVAAAPRDPASLDAAVKALEDDPAGRQDADLQELRDEMIRRLDAIDAELRRLTAPSAAAPDAGVEAEIQELREDMARQIKVIEAEQRRLAAVQEAAAAPAQTPAPSAAPYPKYYIVRRGDCYWDIAALPPVYNDAFKWRTMYQANRAKMVDPDNPDVIEPGMIIEIPSIKGETREGTYDPARAYPTLGD